MMRNLLGILLTLLLLNMISKAQTPTPELDTVNNPVKQIDPEQKVMPSNLKDIDEQARIGSKDLPAAVRRSLRKIEPEDWQKSVMYLDKKRKTYIIQVRGGSGERTYHFNRKGKQLEARPDEEG